jgi:hypothetical protein
VAQVYRFCLDRIGADFGFGYQRRSGNRVGHRSKLCPEHRCFWSGRCLRQGGGECRRSGPGAHSRFRHCVRHGRARRVSGKLMDYPRECYGTHDAAGLKDFHRPHFRGTASARRGFLHTQSELRTVRTLSRFPTWSHSFAERTLRIRNRISTYDGVSMEAPSILRHHH